MVEKVVQNPLFEKKPKQFGIGGSLPFKKNLHRFVKWPKYVRIQRQRRVLNQRLKVPPALNQFTKTMDKNLAASLFKMLLKYRPEDKAAKKERLLKKAEAETAGKTVETKKPIVVKFGINHITYLIEQGKAQLVVIAHDVDPIELVVWLPALCRKMGIPYCIVKGKARLGAVVHKKNATALCLTSVKNEDKHDFSKIVEAVKYRPEDKAAKKERLLKKAEAETAGKTVETKKPIVVKFGINHITYLIEQGKAQLVVIAHDVDPIELVVWLPALCRKMGIPYCIVKGKARLGAVVHKKNATALCLTSVKNEDKHDFSKIVEAVKANFNDREDLRRHWGGGIMGVKSQAKTKIRERVLAKEAAQRMS
eukprot:jgi/Mesen1/7650/ME000040S07215